MSHAAGLAILFHLACCGAVVVGWLSCNGDGPGNCSFQNRNTCSWKNHYGLNAFHFQNSVNYFLALIPYELQGRLQSKTACSTQVAEHCLTFWYYFQRNYVFELKVFVKQHEDDTELVWKVNSSSDYPWDLAKVPIRTDKSFTVTIEVDRLDNNFNKYSVLIDDIRYKTSSCIIHPPSAKPAMTIPTTKSTTTTTTTTTTSEQPSTQTTSAGLKPKPPNMTAASEQKKAASSHSMVGSTESSNSVGIIVGAVVAVVIVVAVAVVVFVLLRRKQLHFWKACFKDGKQTEDFQVTASHNAIYSTDTGDPDAVQMTPADPEQHGNFRLVTRTSTQASDNQYSVIREPGQPSLQDPSVPEYSVVNKPQTIPPVRNKSQSNPYEIGDESAEFSTKQAAENNVYNHIHPGTRERVDYESLSASSVSPATGDYSRLVSPEVKAREPGASETPGLYCNVDTPARNTQRPATTTCGGQAEDYNSLDFDGKSNVEASTDADKNQVYSHLNEGDEDAYNEVDRVKRREVVDGDYSHVQ